MKTASFSDFRKNAAAFFDSVEQGDVIRVLRHGRAIADIVPVVEQENKIPSWKRPAPKLLMKSGSLTKALLQMRRESR